MSQALSLSTVDIVATGTNLATAAPLGQVNFARIISGTGGVRFSNALGGNMIMVKNDTKVSINVYPISSGTIDSLSASSPYVLLSGQSQQFVSPNGVAYYSAVYCSSSSAYIAPTQTITGNTILSSADSGKQIYYPAFGVTYLITMPALQAGLVFDFIMTADVNFNQSLVFPSNTITTNLVSSDAKANVNDTGKTNLDILTGTLKGNWIHVTCDGIGYYAKCQISAQNTIACT